MLWREESAGYFSGVTRKGLEKMKRLITHTKKLVKGMPTAVVVSILFHVGLFVLAGVLVIFTITKPKEIVFDPPPLVKVPKMPLRKLQVKMKKPSKPKASAKITAVVPRPDLHEIQFPDLASSGIGAGLGGGGDLVKFDSIPIFDEEPRVFGEQIDIGNNLVGTFYDFKRRRGGGPVVLDNEGFKIEVSKFTRGGWDTTHLARYYKAPKKLYATSIMIGSILSVFAPDAFGEPDVEGLRWIVHYKGTLVHPKDIKFRFVGAADDILLVRVDGKDVLNGSWRGTEHTYSDWTSSGPVTEQLMGNTFAVYGDWITLKAHERLDMQVVIGEVPGGEFSAMLAVEVEGVDYPLSKHGNPILPMFKTAEPTHDLLDAIYYNLARDEATPIGGPVFCDYGDEPAEEGAAAKEEPEAKEEPVDEKVVEAEKESAEETGLRKWTSTTGETFEGEYVILMGDKVVLRDAKGKNRKIPMNLFSAEDRIFMEMENPPQFKIEFPRASQQHRWPQKEKIYDPWQLPGAIDYTFTAKIKQVSVGSYPHELHIEFFAIGEEIDGNNYILLDHQENTFVPIEKKRNEYHTFSGRRVRLYDYEFFEDGRRGQQYGGYLVLVTDSRGKIIEHKSSYNWLFEKREELEKLGLMNHFDKTCTRVHPPRPKVGRTLRGW